MNSRYISHIHFQYQNYASYETVNFTLNSNIVYKQDGDNYYKFGYSLRRTVFCKIHRYLSSIINMHMNTSRFVGSLANVTQFPIKKCCIFIPMKEVCWLYRNQTPCPHPLSSRRCFDFVVSGSKERFCKFEFIKKHLEI